ncbi:zinc ribbon domain-containing protein [Streptomyces sp. NPDC060002]|uniref:zinc ribbon domain-containing protein n=1 Tax=Streptomyces sp. NPDC060002 TaxID=3347033 RepID=UPI0036ABA5A5
MGAYKARRAGVTFLEVDPAHTSQRCPRCGHTERANRPTQDRSVVGAVSLGPPSRTSRSKRARPYALGVGIRHHARPAAGVAGGGRCDP